MEMSQLRQGRSRAESRVNLLWSKIFRFSLCCRLQRGVRFAHAKSRPASVPVNSHSLVRKPVDGKPWTIRVPFHHAHKRRLGNSGVRRCQVVHFSCWYSTYQIYVVGSTRTVRGHQTVTRNWRCDVAAVLVGRRWNLLSRKTLKYSAQGCAS